MTSKNIHTPQSTNIYRTVYTQIEWDVCELLTGSKKKKEKKKRCGRVFKSLKKQKRIEKGVNDATYAALRHWPPSYSFCITWHGSWVA